jgi:hypothetical protein
MVRVFVGRALHVAASRAIGAPSGTTFPHTVTVSA